MLRSPVLQEGRLSFKEPAWVPPHPVPRTCCCRTSASSLASRLRSRKNRKDTRAVKFRIGCKAVVVTTRQSSHLHNGNGEHAQGTNGCVVCVRMESENLAAIVYWGGKRGGAITSKCTEQSQGIQGPGGPGPSGLAVPLTLRCSLAGAQGWRAYSGRGRGAQCCDILQNVALFIRRACYFARTLLVPIFLADGVLDTKTPARPREGCSARARVSQAGSIRRCLHVPELVSQTLQASSMPSTPTSQSAALPMQSVSWSACS